ncbi:MAG TPA: nitrilase-related carbon-nitrogen hydrolase, partial [Longimicrobiales bacterium]|nr:nitrilase-related carbon-nitrogen hydrolase [Longimicrobiales bacterium]
MSLRLRIHQTAPRVGDVAANLAEMEALVAEAPPGSLVAFPELALTGYDLGSRARDLGLEPSAPPPLRPSSPGTTVVLGFPELARDHRLYNAAGAVDESGWIHRHRKRYLPTYGMFDEGRIFAPGDRGPRTFVPHPSWPTALLVCEELWHPGMAYLAALRGAHLLLVLAAAPGRGSPRDPEEDGPRFRSH